MSEPTDFRCPLCAWRHGVPEVTVAESALAGVFGPGIMRQVAVNKRAEEIEQAIAAHLRGHSVIEWVRRVRELETEVEGLRAVLRASHD